MSSHMLTSKKAAAAFVFGVISLVSGSLALVSSYDFFLIGVPVFFVVALILGIKARRDIARNRGQLSGRALAAWGMGIAVGGTCLGFLLVPAVLRVRDAANRSISCNNLKSIALALQNYHSTHGRFPPAVVRAKDGRPLYSWRVLVLPYLEGGYAFREFKLDEAWDSANNQPLLTRMHKIFQAPAQEGLVTEPGATFYQAIVGPGTAFDEEQGAEQPVDWPEDNANTILMIEAGEAIPWTKPVDVIYKPDQPLPAFGGIFTTEGRFSLFGSNRVKGFHVAFADGSVRWMPANVPETALRALITRNGGERIGGDR